MKILQSLGVGYRAEGLAGSTAIKNLHSYHEWFATRIQCSKNPVQRIGWKVCRIVPGILGYLALTVFALGGAVINALTLRLEERLYVAVQSQNAADIKAIAQDLFVQNKPLETMIGSHREHILETMLRHNRVSSETMVAIEQTYKAQSKSLIFDSKKSPNSLITFLRTAFEKNNSTLAIFCLKLGADLFAEMGDLNAPFNLTTLLKARHRLAVPIFKIYCDIQMEHSTKTREILGLTGPIPREVGDAVLKTLEHQIQVVFKIKRMAELAREPEYTRWVKDLDNTLKSPRLMIALASMLDISKYTDDGLWIKEFQTISQRLNVLERFVIGASDERIPTKKQVLEGLRRCDVQYTAQISAAQMTNQMVNRSDEQFDEEDAFSYLAIFGLGVANPGLRIDTPAESYQRLLSVSSTEFTKCGISEGKDLRCLGITEALGALIEETGQTADLRDELDRMKLVLETLDAVRFARLIKIIDQVDISNKGQLKTLNEEYALGVLRCFLSGSNRKRIQDLLQSERKCTISDLQNHDFNALFGLHG